MNIQLLNNGYEPEVVYIVWDRPFVKLSDTKVYYDIIRDGNIIASNSEDDFPSPSRWDHDHHTNLFFKKSKYQHLYVDTNVRKFETHEYQIVARQISDEVEINNTSSIKKRIQVSG